MRSTITADSAATAALRACSRIISRTTLVARPEAGSCSAASPPRVASWGSVAGAARAVVAWAAVWASTRDDCSRPNASEPRRPSRPLARAAHVFGAVRQSCSRRGSTQSARSRARSASRSRSWSMRLRRSEEEDEEEAAVATTDRSANTTAPYTANNGARCPTLPKGK